MAYVTNLKAFNIFPDEIYYDLSFSYEQTIASQECASCKERKAYSICCNIEKGQVCGMPLCLTCACPLHDKYGAYHETEKTKGTKVIELHFFDKNGHSYGNKLTALVRPLRNFEDKLVWELSLPCEEELKLGWLATQVLHNDSFKNIFIRTLATKDLIQLHILEFNYVAKDKIFKNLSFYFWAEKEKTFL